MEQFYKLSNEYYFKFYSYKKYYPKLKKEFWLAINLGIIFNLYIVAYLIVFLSGDYTVADKASIAILVLFFEIVFLFSHEELKDKRDILALGGNAINIRNAVKRLKNEWISSHTGASASQYFDLVRDFEDAKKIYEKNKSMVELSRNDIKKLIYDIDSKTRIISLFVFLFSVIGLLSIKQAEGIVVVLELFSGAIWWQVLIIYPLFCISLFLMLFGSIYSIRFIINAISIIITNIDGDKAKSDRVIGFFIRDLIRFANIGNK